MADIFISYSSKDREKAEQLTELLGSAGLSVWIDKSALEVSTSWSAEIVDAITSCSAFIVLLSPNSIESHNVIKEVSLASEKRKKILPLDLEPIMLPRELEYQLAGIHRTSMTNIDSIIRALGKLGLEATKAPTLKLIKETPGKKSLMILPFEDLSPTADNGWFADGIVSEMISALSNVKALHLMDAQATKEFKKYQGQLTTYASTMQIRYFVQGSVRKFGDQIKITAQLLDIDTGDYLWQHSLKGVMDNIFDIQEVIANEVLKGLELHLSADEKKKLAERGTENTEAYELFLKAKEYFYRLTRDGFGIAIELLTHALTLDPNFANALQYKAFALTDLYRSYDRNPKHLEESESLAKRALELKPDLWSSYSALPNSYRLQGKLAAAEEAAKEFIRRAPENSESHFALGVFYTETNQPLEAIPHYEKSIELKPGDLVLYLNLVIVSDQSHDEERVTKWSLAALPLYERRLSLVPDDENARVWYANLLRYANQPERALLALEPLLKKQDLDGMSCYNIACLYARLSDTANALTMLRRSVSAGLSMVEAFRTDPDLDPLRGMPEFEALMKELEEKIAKTS